MTATLPRLLVEWFDRGHARISLPDGRVLSAVCDAGWRIAGSDSKPFDLFEDLLGDLQERM